MEKLHDIVAAKPLEGYKVDVTFGTGERGIFDCTRYLDKPYSPASAAFSTVRAISTSPTGSDSTTRISSGRCLSATALSCGPTRSTSVLKTFGNLPKGTKSSYAASRTGAATASSSAASAPRHQIYERTRRELEKETSEEVWEQKNDALRRLGLRTIPNPGE